ncbi:MAG: transaldolase [Planctomycetota bacterium]|jgi:transaldolase
MSQLDQLKTMTTVVADTGDFNAIKQFTPRDATTNPSLIYKASQQTEYRELIHEAIAYGEAHGKGAVCLDLCLMKLAVNFGCEILKIVPGRVSTETNADSSFDTDKLIAEGRQIISMYENAGVDRERVLIKIASTWEGIRAADKLEDEGIHCNLTLMFSIAQAVACAEAGVTLISPFVGRIYDWHKKDRGVDHIPAAEDPGVQSVTAIYNYYRKFGYNTEVMGASFRNTGEILELAGCDLLTISPALLEELRDTGGAVPRRLDPDAAHHTIIDRLDVSEPQFRWIMNQDAMATEKLAEGIRGFDADWRRLRGEVVAMMGQAVGA